MGSADEDNGFYTFRRNGPSCADQLRDRPEPVHGVQPRVRQEKAGDWLQAHLTHGPKVKLQRGARMRTCVKAWAESDVEAQWASTNWAKKIAAQKRKATISDFQRFKDMVAKKSK